jgi:hypothetical protein
LFVEGDRRDGIFRAAQGVGEGERGMGFGVAGAPVVSVFFVTQREEVVFGGSDAMEAELDIGAGVGQLDFDRTNWRQRCFSVPISVEPSASLRLARYGSN